jgi:hypothetical protein
LLELIHFLGSQDQFRAFRFSCHTASIAGHSQSGYILMKLYTSDFHLRFSRPIFAPHFGVREFTAAQAAT